MKGEAFCFCRRERVKYYVMEAYCLFCNTNRCRQIASEIYRKFGFTAYSPAIIQRKWIKGRCCEESKDYLPGYVFLYSDVPIRSFREIIQIDGVLRFLGDKETGFALRDDDRTFAETIYKRQGQIGVFKAFEVGKRVYLTKESLAGMEGEIVKLDRRKGRAQVAFRFDSKSFRIWIAYDMITEVQ